MLPVLAHGAGDHRVDRGRNSLLHLRNRRRAAVELLLEHVLRYALEGWVAGQ